MLQDKFEAELQNVKAELTTCKEHLITKDREIRTLQVSSFLACIKFDINYISTVFDYACRRFVSNRVYLDIGFAL